MRDVAEALASNRRAVDEFIAAAEGVASTWTTPRAPGKWSPSQVVEHVARTYEEAAKLVAGSPSAFPNVPGLLRPVMRGLFFKRILKKGAFMNAKTFKALDPEQGPPSASEARARVEGAVQAFEKACAVAGDTVSSAVFGKIALTDYVRFNALHARHHQKQLFIEGSR